MTTAGLGILLILAGLVMLWLSPSAPPLLARIVWWVGVVLVVLGLVLILAPVVIWLERQLRSALNL